MSDHRLSDHHVGPVGEARRLPRERLAPMLVGDTIASLDCWWLRLPGAGMMIVHVDDVDTANAIEVIVPDDPKDRLDTYTMGLITLADIPGVTPPNKTWPWVTHELVVHTVHAGGGLGEFESPFPWPLMQPHNVSVQFHVDDDDQARHLVHDIAFGIVNGLLPAEVQAFVPERHKMMTLLPLHDLWVDTVTATAEHMRTGGTHQEPHP